MSTLVAVADLASLTPRNLQRFEQVSRMAALGGYLTAKFLWNPDYAQDRAMNAFLDGYYG